MDTISKRFFRNGDSALIVANIVTYMQYEKTIKIRFLVVRRFFHFPKRWSDPSS